MGSVEGGARAGGRWTGVTSVFPLPAHSFLPLLFSAPCLRLIQGEWPGLDSRGCWSLGFHRDHSGSSCVCSILTSLQIMGAARWAGDTAGCTRAAQHAMPDKKWACCVHTAAGDPGQEPVVISPGPGQLQMWVGGFCSTGEDLLAPSSLSSLTFFFLGRKEPAPQGLLDCAVGCAHRADEVPAGRGKEPLFSIDQAPAVALQARSTACSSQVACQLSVAPEFK